MKKICSLFLALIMLICMVPISAGATTPAQDDAEKLIFDLDLSDYANANTVKNAVPGADSVITVGGTKKPALGVLANGKKYVNFKEAYNSEATQSYIEVADDAFLNQNELTIETWVRPKGYTAESKQDMLFKLFSDDNANVSYWDMYRWQTSWLRHRPSGNAEGDTGIRVGEVVTANQNKWTHMVFTRKWTPDADCPKDGTWESAFYINGKRVDEGKTTTFPQTDRPLEAETSKLLIGNGSKVIDDLTFIGDIASFKVYQSTLAEVAVADKYEESRGMFAEYGEDKLVFDMDLSEYTNSNPVVKSTYNDSSVITLQGTPTLGTTAAGQKYLTFDNLKGTANSKDADAQVGIKVVDDLFMNQDAMTVEVLARGNNFGKKPADRYRNYLFQGPSMQVHVMDTTANSILCWDPVGDKGDAFRLKQGDMQTFNDKWTHFVFTKAYDSAAGKWVAYLYIDGEQKKTAEYSTALGNETSNELTIGISKDLGRSFDGDIALFKVYNTELTADAIKTKYAQNHDMMSELISISDFDTASTQISATLDSSLTASNPCVIIALYNNEGRLIKTAQGTTLNVNDIILKSGDYVRCFVWNNLTDLTPLTTDSIAYCR